MKTLHTVKSNGINGTKGTKGTKTNGTRDSGVSSGVPDRAFRKAARYAAEGMMLEKSRERAAETALHYACHDGQILNASELASELGKNKDSIHREIIAVAFDSAAEICDIPSRGAYLRSVAAELRK